MDLYQTALVSEARYISVTSRWGQCPLDTSRIDAHIFSSSVCLVGAVSDGESWIYINQSWSPGQDIFLWLFRLRGNIYFVAQAGPTYFHLLCAWWVLSLMVSHGFISTSPVAQ